MKSPRFMLLVLVLASGLLLGSCGKKGPPVAPSRLPLPEVTGLTADHDGDMVTLRWRSDAPEESTAAYIVYRSAYPLSGPVCPTCHQVFQNVGTVPVEKGGGALSFSEQVPPGFRYTYKVTPRKADGVSGPDSNPAVIEVPQE